MPKYEDYTAEKTELLDFRAEEKFANIKLYDHMTVAEMSKEILNTVQSFLSCDNRLQRANSGFSSKLYKLWDKQREEDKAAQEQKKNG